jgi:hypothetical protein
VAEQNIGFSKGFSSLGLVGSLVNWLVSLLKLPAQVMTYPLGHGERSVNSPEWPCLRAVS